MAGLSQRMFSSGINMQQVNDNRAIGKEAMEF